MPVRLISPRQSDGWTDEILQAAYENRPLPAGHPLSWGALRRVGEYGNPVFSDPELRPLPPEPAQ